MKIHIVGASGSGVTTLGQHLSTALNLPYWDSDDFFWERTEPPYTTPRDPAERNDLLQGSLAETQSWLMGGSIMNWKLELHFDLIVFLYIPKEIRMDRLKQREMDRYGDLILSDKSRQQQHLDFLGWAAGYDDNTSRGRTLRTHRHWLGLQTCPVLELTDDLSVPDRAEQVLDFIFKIN